MDFGLSEHQNILKKSARDFLARECPKKLVREMFDDEKGYPPQLWKRIADLGWVGMVFPEEYDGGGGDFLDLTVLLEEMGRACLPGPFLSTVIAGMIILEAGNENQKRKLLPKIAAGESIVTLAITESSALYTPEGINATAIAEEQDYIMSGTKLFVPDAHVADCLICVVRTEDSCAKSGGITLFLVDSKSTGISCNPLLTMAGNKEFEVLLDKVSVPQGNMLGELGQGWEVVESVLRKAAVAKCAEMVGAAHQALELTVDYVKERVQFGRPVGSFQAVQHHCANMLIALEGARFLTYEAAWLISENLPHAKEVAMAKAWASDACNKVVLLAHQCTGGVSLIEDHDMPLYTRRIKQDETTYGDADFHREFLACELGL